MSPDSPESRIGRLEMAMAALKERVELTQLYVTRDIAGLTSTVDEMRKLLREQADREQEREDRERERDKADRRARLMQTIQVIGIVATFIGLLIAYLSLKSATGG